MRFAGDATARVCEACGGTIHGKVRADARYCSSTCRARVSKHAAIQAKFWSRLTTIRRSRPACRG